VNTTRIINRLSGTLLAASGIWCIASAVHHTLKHGVYSSEVAGSMAFLILVAIAVKMLEGLIRSDSLYKYERRDYDSAQHWKAVVEALPVGDRVPKKDVPALLEDMAEQDGASFGAGVLRAIAAELRKDLTP